MTEQKVTGKGSAIICRLLIACSPYSMKRQQRVVVMRWRRLRTPFKL